MYLFYGQSEYKIVYAWCFGDHFVLLYIAYEYKVISNIKPEFYLLLSLVPWISYLLSVANFFFNLVIKSR